MWYWVFGCSEWFEMRISLRRVKDSVVFSGGGSV
jgi:hypothetical protein